MLLPSTHQSYPNNPSPPSSSSNIIKSTDELGQSHLSNFFIRDYAFSYRTKDINKSWPFSSTNLQLCLKHGVNDPLPPIQHKVHSFEALVLKTTNISYNRLDSNHTLAETKQSFENGLLASGSKSKIQVAIINKNPRKKCVESGSKEDRSCVVSESMGLRTCPICKSFSSASNTTLNAHIDQCLSADSEQQPTVKSNKTRIKPRMKVKSMIDVYAAAKECTLEDLDKRNGTKWAVIPSYCNRVVSDNKPEGKKDGAGIGPVYIDARGQKLRILSEKQSSSKGKLKYRRLQGKKYNKHCKPVLKDNASEVPKYQRRNSEEGRGIKRSESQCRIINQRMLTRNGSQKGNKNCVLRDEPFENGDSYSGDSLVLKGPSHVSTDLSETVTSSLNSQKPWRTGWKSQDFSRKESASFVANPCKGSEAKGDMKLKKARSDDEDSGKWESEMTQEHEMTDYDNWDDNEETDVLLGSNPSVSCEEYDYESYKETGNNKEEGRSSFMEIDPIPIPGPPGSFLPSPWEMGTNAIENHGNSLAIITTQLYRNPSQSPEKQTFSLHNTFTIDKSDDQLCCCQRKDKAFQDTTFVQQDLDLLSKHAPAIPSNSNPVLRLMGKDLMVINQREEEEAAHGDSTLQPISQFLHSHGKGLYFDTSTNFYNIP